MSKRQRLITIVGILISAVFLWIAFNDLNPAAVWTHIRSANMPLILLSAVWYFSNIIVISMRWQYLMRPVRFVPLRKLFELVCIAYMGNNVYPLRAGEALRIALLNRDERIPIAQAGMVVIIERIFDGLVMLTFIVVALPLLNIASEEMRSITLVSAPLFLILLGAFFVVALRPQLLRWMIGVFSRLLPGKLATIVSDLGEDVIAGLECLRTPGDLFKAIVLSYGSWLLAASAYWLVALAFNLTVDLPTMLLAVGAVNLAGLIPASPGQFGVFEFFIILVLTAVGVDEAQATAYALALHAIVWLPVTLLGFYYLARRGLGLGALTRASDLQKEGTAS